MIQINNLKENIEIYNQNGYKIELVDFRKNLNEQLECITVSLNENSSLVETDKYWKKYAITNYNLKDMHKHHKCGVHEYLIPKIILNADVIINIPKPKTHRKAGITACMKNFVGINSKKEYLPHHRSGNIYRHGDEYPEKSILKKMTSFVKKYSYTNNFIIRILVSAFIRLERLCKKGKYIEGSWYGNDTIWRTILDINKIILYADKNGIITNKKQRVIFNIADMIIAGEKEGPLLPSPKSIGYIISGFNQLNTDKTICEIMGFNYNKIKYIKSGYMLKKYCISTSKKFNIIVNPSKQIKKIHFQASEGWKEYLNSK